jgi:hypothetical protein
LLRAAEVVALLEILHGLVVVVVLEVILLLQVLQ